MPSVSGFRPYGGRRDGADNGKVFLFFEEYEALRLNDYEKYAQCESAAVMGVSRPTFTRIYIQAREKIARAFVEGRSIVIEGGKVESDGEWYVCRDCKAVFSDGCGDRSGCALCGSRAVERYDAGCHRGGGRCRRDDTLAEIGDESGKDGTSGREEGNVSVGEQSGGILEEGGDGFRRHRHLRNTCFGN